MSTLPFSEEKRSLKRNNTTKTIIKNPCSPRYRDFLNTHEKETRHSTRSDRSWENRAHPTIGRTPQHRNHIVRFKADVQGDEHRYSTPHRSTNQTRKTPFCRQSVDTRLLQLRKVGSGSARPFATIVQVYGQGTIRKA